MKKTLLHTRPQARFRRFTRKGYSAFSSLGRCVTIGHLGKGETEASLNKQKQGVFLTGTQQTGQRKESHDEEVPIPPRLLLQQLFPSILLPATANDVCCHPAVAINRINNTHRLDEYPKRYLSGFLHFNIYPRRI